ncbi:hypothetical protein QBA54_50760 [Streptomyces sp. B21-108]|uniref:hypothetical protein n=1 Tax=Streptomyces sp. B21-108 TaxID=3039419 RepID=UPI002FF36675
MKPVKVIPKIEREHAPWSLITSQMDGHFRSRSWSGEIPEGTEHIALYDRNGSYMSAMSSVPLAPNRLTHTGAWGTDTTKRQGRAGIVCILNFEWTRTDVPHPLGRTVEGVLPGEPVWIMSNQLEWLDQQAAKGNLPVVDVVDSWTGNRNTSLFEPFYKWSKVVRESTSGDERVEAKRAMSRAIRSLHPVQARSPFWRPDWHKAALAEAALRHFIKADQAVQQGAALVSIGAVDEVAFAVPAGEDPQLWVPPGYRMGAGYGEVKHKEVLVQGEKVMSPVTVEQWNQRGRAPRRG